MGCPRFEWKSRVPNDPPSTKSIERVRLLPPEVSSFRSSCRRLRHRALAEHSASTTTFTLACA